jgi:predicted dinucleotide-binding enzyme
MILYTVIIINALIIEGDESNMGIVPRSMTVLFDAAAERAEAIDFNFRVSYIEIYMEKIKDLLADQVIIDCYVCGCMNKHVHIRVYVYIYMYIYSLSHR